MNYLTQQDIEANKLELERLEGLLKQVDDYAKQISGHSIFELECLLENALEFDSLYNSENSSEDDSRYDYQPD